MRFSDNPNKGELVWIKITEIAREVTQGEDKTYYSWDINGLVHDYGGTEASLTTPSHWKGKDGDIPIEEGELLRCVAFDMAPDFSGEEPTETMILQVPEPFYETVDRSTSELHQLQFYDGFPVPGDLVQCRVEEIEGFGAFVELLEYGNKRGLIHESEVAEGWDELPQDHLFEGQWVACKVLDVDREDNTIDLSRKGVNHSI